VWDEYYDCIENPQERLVYIATVMRQIANWTPEERDKKMAQAQDIADYNKQHFFSQEFFNLVTNELKTNLTTAFAELEQTNTSGDFLHRRQVFTSDLELVELSKNSKKPETREQTFQLAQHYNQRHQS
jgi:hypothetical protein